MAAYKIHRFSKLNITIFYTESVLTGDGKCHTETLRRIGKAKYAFQKPSKLLRIRKISFVTKERVLDSYVISLSYKTVNVEQPSKRLRKVLNQQKSGSTRGYGEYKELNM